MKVIARRLLNLLVRLFGRPIKDLRTGENVGRAWVVPFTNPPRILGLHFPYLKPVFLPESATHYGRQKIGFATHAPVDFPRIRPAAPAPSRVQILWVVLLHQEPARCREILQTWEAQDADILPIHGGSPADAGGMIHISDPTLRTTNHPLEKQSYRSVWQKASAWMKSRDITHVCFAEYDHIPLVSNLGQRLVSSMGSADVLFHHLCRVDGTSAPHYLHHLSDPVFAAGPWRALSLREDPGVVLNALATGSCWTREAFDAVSGNFPESRIYLEMDLPTTAHHLGFRVVTSHEEATRFVGVHPWKTDPAEAASRGAWSIHPVK